MSLCGLLVGKILEPFEQYYVYSSNDVIIRLSYLHLLAGRSSVRLWLQGGFRRP